MVIGRIPLTVRGSAASYDNVQPRFTEDLFHCERTDPLLVSGKHGKTNRRYWFYEAEPAPEAQLAYLDGLKKLTEAELRTFIEGMSLPEAYRPIVAAPYTPPTSGLQYPSARQSKIDCAVGERRENNSFA